MAEKKKTKSAKKAAPKKKKTTKKAAEVREEVVVAEVVAQPEPVAAVKKPVVAAVPKPKKEKLPKGAKYYGTGRRKEAVAKVWLRPGSGKIIVNSHPMSVYFCGRKVLEFQVTRPLNVTNTQSSYDVFAEAFGGGIPGQAGAVSLGIARALLEVNPELRVKLKREGLLRRDPRMKERKKYGLKRARKAFQYTKR